MVAVSVIGGSGDLGFGLALRLGWAGVPVTIGSRDGARAAEAVERLTAQAPQGRFRAAENADAAAGADVVVLAVPLRAQRRTLRDLGLGPGQILLDATVPLASEVGGRPTQALALWHGSAAEQAAELVPAGVGVVSALHTVAAARLTDLTQRFEQDVLICGDSDSDKRTVADLLRLIPGFRCVDCGPLEASRLTERLTPLLIGLNSRYRAKAGVRIVGLPEVLWA